MNLSAAWPYSFIRVASGRDYSRRSRSGFFQKETSQAELVSKPTLMKQE